jgi:hypothetical protein
MKEKEEVKKRFCSSEKRSQRDTDLIIATAAAINSERV